MSGLLALCAAIDLGGRRVDDVVVRHARTQAPRRVRPSGDGLRLEGGGRRGRPHLGRDDAADVRVEEQVVDDGRDRRRGRGPDHEQAAIFVVGALRGELEAGRAGRAADDERARPRATVQHDPGRRGHADPPGRPSRRRSVGMTRSFASGGNVAATPSIVHASRRPTTTSGRLGGGAPAVEDSHADPGRGRDRAERRAAVVVGEDRRGVLAGAGPSLARRSATSRHRGRSRGRGTSRSIRARSDRSGPASASGWASASGSASASAVGVGSELGGDSLGSAPRTVRGPPPMLPSRTTSSVTTTPMTIGRRSREAAARARGGRQGSLWCGAGRGCRPRTIVRP